MFETTDKGQLVIRYIRTIAAGQPDKVIEPNGCYYVEIGGGCASCLIGQGLWKAGLIDEEFEHHPNNGTSIAGGWATDRWAFSRDEVDWMYIVQKAQDSQWNWAAAVALADAWLARCVMTGKDFHVMAQEYVWAKPSQHEAA